MRALSACPSPAHRGVMGLLSVALGGAEPPGLAADLARAAPETLARFAAQQHVHTAMAPAIARAPTAAAALPRDLRLWFGAMHEANAARLADGRAQLARIGAALAEAGLPAVVLKGGADMLDPLHADPALRFVSDLDLLVPAARAAEAAAILHRLGGRSERYNPHMAERMHHLPAIVHPGWAFPVELHRRVGQGALDALLPAEHVLAACRPSALPGIALPAPEDRACHLLAHAWRTDTGVPLRAVADWMALQPRLGPELERTVAARLSSHGFGAAQAGIAALSRRIADPARPAAGLGAANRWASGRLRHYARPGLAPAALTARWLAGYMHRALTSAAYRRHLLARLRSRPAWQDAVAQHRAHLRRLR